MTSPLSLPTGPARRSVITAAAWTVPVVTLASSAPAFAASACETTFHTINWSTSTWTPNRRDQNASQGTVVATSSASGAPAVVLSVTRQFFGNMVAASNGAQNNMQISDTNVGGSNARGLTLLQQQTSAGSNPGGNQNVHDHRQTVTFTFSQPVKNLRFTVTDIDNNWTGSTNTSGRQYRDRCYVSGAPTATTPLLGSGTQAAPWYRNTSLGAVDNVTSTAGNVTLDYGSTEVQQVQVTYYNGYERPLVSDGIHAIYISRMSFDVETCA